MPAAPSASPASLRMHAEFRAAAQEVTSPLPAPSQGRQERGSSDRGLELSTASLADSYIGLCHDPCKDIGRWIDEDTRHRRSSFLATPLTGEGQKNENSTRGASVVAVPAGLRGDTLYEMQSRLDPHGREGLADSLSAGPRTSISGHDQLRSVSAPRGVDAAHDAEIGAGEFGAELGAISAHFAERKAAVRASLSPQDAAAALRSLQSEQVLAMRAVVDRWMIASRNASQRRSISPPSRPIELIVQLRSHDL